MGRPTQQSDRQSSASIMDRICADVAGRSFQDNKWGERHARAWSDALLFARSGANAQYPSRCIVPMIVGWVRYADSHRARYEGGVAECGVMGPAWEQIGRALKTMLNGELDALDAGTLDQIIGSVLLNEGFGDE